ncbi:MAG: TolC family protein [Pseudomonadota bacterium]
MRFKMPPKWRAVLMGAASAWLAFSASHSISARAQSGAPTSDTETQAIKPAAIRPLDAVDPDPFRLAVRDAVYAHPNVRGALAERARVKQTRREALAGLLPTLSVGLAGQQQISSSFDDAPADLIVESARPRRRVDVSVDGEQLIFDSGATFARMDAADERIDEAAAQTLVEAGTVALRAVRAYLEVAQFNRLKAVGAALVDRHNAILSQVSLRYDNGVGSVQDVARVEARKATAIAQLAGFDRGFAAAQSRFQQLFREVSETAVLRPALLAGAAITESDKLALALAVNPAMRQAQARAKAADFDYKAVRRGNLPSVSVAVNATRFGVFQDRNDFDVRGRLVMDYDLFAGGARKARERQSFQQARQAAFQSDQIRLEVERDTRIAVRDLAVLTTQIETLQSALLANRNARDAFTEQFAVARGSLLDLLQAEADFFAAEIALINGTMERDIAHYRLLVQTGEVFDVFGIDFSFALGDEAHMRNTQGAP